jgi:phage major head subunit gpT-like protein
MVPSSTSEQKYGWLGKITKFREWLGERQVQNLLAHDYSIKNKTFENTVGVDRDEIEDDQYGVYKPVFEQLGQDAATHPDELVFELLKTVSTRLATTASISSTPTTRWACPTSKRVSNFQGGSGDAGS